MKFFNSILFIFIFLTSNSHSDDNFNKWLLNYKQFAINQGVTKQTVDEAFKNTKHLKRIIKYDRNQPEFIEKTKVYVGKRVNKQKVIYAKKLIKNIFNFSSFVIWHCIRKIYTYTICHIFSF